VNVSVTISGKAGFAGRAPNFAVEVTGLRETDTGQIRAAITEAAEGWLAANPALVWEAETAKATAKIAQQQASPMLSVTGEFAGYDLGRPAVPLEVPGVQWCVVLSGRVVGPFPSNDAAARYCGMIATGEPRVARLYAPFAPPEPESGGAPEGEETTAERPPDRYHPQRGFVQGAPPADPSMEHPAAYRRRDSSGTIPGDAS